MAHFGKRLREARERKGMSQSELARLLGTNHSIVGKYEREEVTPSIDAVTKIAGCLDTTVSYLIGEATGIDVLKDPKMLQRLQELSALPQYDREHILYAFDGLLRDAKARQTYAA